MRAVAIDRFGGIDVLKVQEVPVPDRGPDEVLIRLESAGVGEWDPFEREGGYTEMQGTPPKFPYVLGSEGAGVIAAAGAKVTDFKEGDRVYATGFLNPKGGFYAEYAVVPAQFVTHLPQHLTMDQGSALSGVAITALRGLEDVLNLRSGETLLVFGASGGVGHMAVQLAKHAGARVFAVASGTDGVALAKRLGADAVVDGHSGSVEAACREFAPEGFDAALVTAGGDAANAALKTMRAKGRVAYPNGVEPEPVVAKGVQRTAYNADPDAEIVKRLTQRVLSGRLDVHVDRVFPLEQVAQAQQAVERHHCGKLVLRIVEKQG